MNPIRHLQKKNLQFHYWATVLLGHGRKVNETTTILTLVSSLIF